MSDMKINARQDQDAGIEVPSNDITVLHACMPAVGQCRGSISKQSALLPSRDPNKLESSAGKAAYSC